MISWCKDILVPYIRLTTLSILFYLFIVLNLLSIISNLFEISCWYFSWKHLYKLFPVGRFGFEFDPKALVLMSTPLLMIFILPSSNSCEIFSFENSGVMKFESSEGCRETLNEDDWKSRNCGTGSCSITWEGQPKTALLAPFTIDINSRSSFWLRTTELIALPLRPYGSVDYQAAILKPTRQPPTILA